MLSPISNYIYRVSLCKCHCVSGDLFAPSVYSFPTFSFLEFHWHGISLWWSFLTRDCFNLCGCDCIMNMCDLRAETIYHPFLSVMNPPCLDCTDNAILYQYLVSSIDSWKQTTCTIHIQQRQHIFFFVVNKKKAVWVGGMLFAASLTDHSPWWMQADEV